MRSEYLTCYRRHCMYINCYPGPPTSSRTGTEQPEDSVLVGAINSHSPTPLCMRQDQDLSRGALLGRREHAALEVGARTGGPEPLLLC